MTEYKGHIIDVVGRRVFDGVVTVADGRIGSIRECEIPANCKKYIMPGFIDSHVHIESSMMIPSEFARVAVEHGTIGIVTDPHEIANVMGEEGIDFMLQNSRQITFNFCFGASSCVPSCGTDIETSGCVLDSAAIERLMARDEIGYLSEVMNYPGVLDANPEVMAKIAAAKRHGKPVDGHAPGLTGEKRMQYASAGISTEHECTTLQEARDCVKAGMMVILRNGSASKDYDALIPLMKEAPQNMMFCTDDCHPSDLIRGHINTIVDRAIEDGYDMWDVLNAACVNPQRHYGLNWGLLREGDPATFIIVTELGQRMRVECTYIRGQEVYNAGSFLNAIQSQNRSITNQMALLDNYPNKFTATPITIDDIALDLKPGDHAHVIKSVNGTLLTGHEQTSVSGNPLKDAAYPWYEVQKLVVYNRYTPGAKPVVGLIRGFGLKNGAMAATVAHDCHNIVAIGTSDEYLVKVINHIVEMKGGMVALCDKDMVDIPLPIGGLMSPLSGHEVAYRSKILRETIAAAGCPMASPFITMSFVCLPVIPELKLTDKGLFDSVVWQFIR